MLKPHACAALRADAKRSRRRARGITLVEVLITLALCALGLMATLGSLRAAVGNQAAVVGAHIASLSPAESRPQAPRPPPPLAAPEPEKKRDGGGFWGKAWNFVLDNAPIVSEARTLMDPNASWLDKGLAVVSLASYFTPAGPAVKLATKGVGLAARGARDVKRADKAVDLADDVDEGADLAGAAGKRKREPEAEDPSQPKPDEPDCQDGICRYGCFAAGTMVWSEHGHRPIESIAIGDRVWSRDPRTGVIALKRVLQTFIHDSPVMSLLVSDGTQAEQLTVTPNHPFWVDGAGWRGAGELPQGAQLSTAAGSLTALSAPASLYMTRVYNFEVEDSHTYFVGLLHAWVHNDCEWEIDEDTLDALHDNYGPDIAEGVRYNAERYAQGATSHALPGIGKDPEALAKYLAKKRDYPYRDASTGKEIAYDEDLSVLIIKEPGRVHAYEIPPDDWSRYLLQGRYKAKGG